MIEKEDIKNEHDIKTLVDSFYKKIERDNKIGHIFNDIIKLNWDTHLPIMYRFWSSVLFSDGSYRGNPLLKHLDINKKIPINETHFDRWIKLWSISIDELFIGEKAESAKLRASNMKNVILNHINRGH